MVTIRATELMREIPDWAVLERQLIKTMNGTPEYVLEKYANPDGSLKWPVDPDYTSIDALDDMYESFHNWPLFYLLGGDGKFLALSHREYDAITEQFTHYSCGHGHPIVVKEYEQGYDWMHQSEGYLFFYFLNLADPRHPKNIERSINYAGFLLNEDPDAINYDEEHNILKCCYLGSMGAAHRNFDRKPWMWADWKQWYGLPYNDLPGILTIDDMHDVEKARQMAEAMCDRLAYSDTVVNLMSTSMVMNAYLHTGDEKYRRWILTYIGTWRKKTEENGGLVPDNIGPDGRIGGSNNGKWYGGYYGWTWPHGFYFIADALTIACENEALLNRDAGGIQWVRDQYDHVISRAIEKDGQLYCPQKHGDPGALQEYFASPERFLTEPDNVTANPKFRRLVERDGWYEFSALPKPQPTHLWFASREECDMERIRKTLDFARGEWTTIIDGYSKYQGGQDMPWLNYLQGGLPDYPERILRHNLKQTYTRMKVMREDTELPENYTDSYLQKRNPITVEGLVQLTMGGPMPIYNGGLLTVSVMYYDAEARRPGLPEDVAALVSKIDEDGITLELRNLNPVAGRALILKAGAFGEHRFDRVTYDGQSAVIEDKWVALDLPAGSEIRMRMDMTRYCNAPGYSLPY